MNTGPGFGRVFVFLRGERYSFFKWYNQYMDIVLSETFH